MEKKANKKNEEKATLQFAIIQFSAKELDRKRAKNIIDKVTTTKNEIDNIQHSAYRSLGK